MPHSFEQPYLGDIVDQDDLRAAGWSPLEKEDIWAPATPSLSRLGRYARQLGRLGLIIVALTGINLISTVAVTLFKWYLMQRFASAFQGGSSSNYTSYYVNQYLPLVVVPLAAAMCVIAAVALFDVLRKRGDVIYDELTNYFQEAVVTTDASTEPTSGERLRFRLILREYVAVTNLPIIPGRFGPAIYAGINLLMMFTTIIFVTAIR